MKTVKQISIFSVLLLASFALVSCSYAPNDLAVKKVQKNLISKSASDADMDFPSHDPSITAGKKVYAQNCAGCHGAKPSRNLSLERMRSRTPQEQYLVVTKGNIKGMPAFKDNLTREERWDALLYVRTSMLGYYAESGGEYAELSALFGGNCAVCHGTRGHGDGPLHKSLQPLPANFNDFSRLYTRTDDKLFDEISHGIPWTAMPAWKDRYDSDKNLSFDDELRWRLVRYVRQFGFRQGVDRLEEGRNKINKFKEKVKAKREGAQ